MTFIQRLLVCSGVALWSLVSEVGVGSASACSTTTPLTYYGGYVDADDQPGNIVYVFWGYTTYGDPQSFKAAALAEFNSPYGISTTKFYNIPTQYSGYDWNSGAYEQISPTPGAYYVIHEAGLPAPNPVTGLITLTDTDIGNEADFIGNYFGLSYDDIVVVLPPSNAPPPVPGLCGRHYIAPQNTIAAWVSYPGQGGCSFVNQELVIQHEITEAVTDPAWNLGTSYEGWDQGTGAYCEISDICQGAGFLVQTQPASSSPSIIRTQTELSNEAIAAGKDGCIYGRATTAYIAGLFSGFLYTSTVTADTSLTINNGFSWGQPQVALTGTPAVASWGKDHLDVFARGTNNKIYHATSDDGGSSATWELLSSSTNFTQSPDAVTWGAGNVQVFGVQGTKIVKNTKDYGASWSGWTTVNKPSGVNPVSKVTVTSWGANNASGGFPTDVRTVVAAFRGSDGKVWFGNSSSGGSFGWQGFTAPASLTGDVDLSAWAPPRLDLFVLDTSGNLWDMISTDGTTVNKSVNFGHPSAGGFQIGGGATGMGDGRLLLGGRVGSNTPYVQFWNWHGGSWASVGFPFTSPIDIAAP